jgi:hypothetical protein
MMAEPPRLKKAIQSMREGGTLISPRLRDLITVTSFGLWVVNNALDMAIQTYEAVQSINAAFLIIASASFAAGALSRSANKKGDDKE